MKKLYVFALLLSVIAFLLSGTAGTAGWYREDETENLIAIGNLKGRVVEEYEQDTVVMPGDKVSKVVKVENTGLSDGLVRVRLEPVWRDTEEAADPEILGIETGGDSWEYDAGTGYYYYLQVLKPGELTTPVMTGFELDGPAVGNSYSDRPGRITVYMEMVQALADGITFWGKDGTDPEIDYTSMTVIGDAPDTGVAFCGPEDGFVFEAEQGDLFRGFKEMLPGESRVQEIDIKNSWSEGAEFFLRAEPGETADKQPNVLLSDENGGERSRITGLQARLLGEYASVNIYSGSELVYSGPVWTEDNGGLYGGGISLGTFRPGDDGSIRVELSVDKAVDNDFMDLIGSVNWIFSASAGDEPAPQTGDRALTPMLILALCSGVCTVALAAGKLVHERKGRRAAAAVIMAAGLGIGAVLLAGGMTGSTLAFMTDSQKAENRIEPGRLKIELDEPGFVPGTVLAPGEGTAKDPEVANTGTVPMLAYVTVSIPVKTVRLVDTDKVSVLPPAPTQLFTFENSDRWTLLDTREAEDGNVFSFGYLAVLEPGEVSDPVFEEIRLASVLEGELPEGTELLVRVEAIGLQAENICEQLPIRERVEYGYFNLIVPAAAEAAG